MVSIDKVADIKKPEIQKTVETVKEKVTELPNKVTSSKQEDSAKFEVDFGSMGEQSANSTQASGEVAIKNNGKVDEKIDQETARKVCEEADTDKNGKVTKHEIGAYRNILTSKPSRTKEEEEKLKVATQLADDFDDIAEQDKDRTVYTNLATYKKHPTADITTISYDTDVRDDSWNPLTWGHGTIGEVSGPSDIGNL